MSFTENKAFKQRSPYAIFEDEVCRADTMRSLISDKELNYIYDIEQKQAPSL